MLDLVTRLVDRSLVVVTAGPTGPRYRLLESVAAYATERLHEMEDLTGVRDRHLLHYRALAEHAEPQLRGAGQRPWLARLDAEAGNLRTALDEAVRRAEAGDSEEAVRLATALAWWWLLRGRLTEARRSLGTVLAVTDGPPELSLLHAAFALLTGDPAAAASPADAPAPALALTSASEAIPDPVRRARALWLCAYGLFSAGDVTGSGELNTRALTLFAAAGDRWGTAAALGLRATLALVGGDLTGLGRDGTRSALIFRELGDQWGELQAVSPLAALAEIKGAYADAERRQHEGLRMARELGLEAEVSARLSGLGRLALLARDFGRARDLHEQARRIAAEQGYKYGEIHSEMGLALGARRSGDLDGAEAHLLHIRDGYADVSSRRATTCSSPSSASSPSCAATRTRRRPTTCRAWRSPAPSPSPAPWPSPWRAWPARPPCPATPPPPPMRPPSWARRRPPATGPGHRCRPPNAPTSTASPLRRGPRWGRRRSRRRTSGARGWTRRRRAVRPVRRSLPNADRPIRS